MRRWKLILYSVLICLPAALLVAGGVCFVVSEVPRAVHRELTRIGLEYREIAAELAADPGRADYSGGRMRGWRQSGRIGEAPWGAEVGFDKEGLRTRVWVKTGGREWRAVEVEAIRPFPYEPVFYGGGALVALVLVGLSWLAVHCFVRFMRERDDFLAATAHDLTTPLVGMRRMIGRDDSEARRLNERMLLIVSNVKDFLRLGGRRRPPVLVRCDLAELVREAYRLFDADYEDSEGGAVVFDFSRLGGGPAVVLADEAMTLQVLWNLFGNDLKYAAPYGGVRVALERDGTRVKVRFIDEGLGMTPRQMRRAFDRYYRARTVLETGKGGFGIGLCTARGFARAMGGELEVCRNAPRGCIFTLSLPAAF